MILYSVTSKTGIFPRSSCRKWKSKATQKRGPCASVEEGHLPSQQTPTRHTKDRAESPWSFGGMKETYSDPQTHFWGSHFLPPLAKTSLKRPSNTVAHFRLHYKWCHCLHSPLCLTLFQKVLWKNLAYNSTPSLSHSSHQINIWDSRLWLQSHLPLFPDLSPLLPLG